MSVRAAQTRTGPSLVFSLLLILIGSGLIATWVALPARRRGTDWLRLVRLVDAARGDPFLRGLTAAEIAALDEPELLEVVETLASGSFRGGEPLDPEGRALLEQALASIEPRALVGFLERCAPSGDAGVRREALRLVAAHAGPEGVDGLLDIACGRSPADLEESAADFERSLGALFARAPEALEYLPGAWCRSPDAAFTVMVRAAGGCGRASALEVLTDTLGRVPDADGLVLAEIGRLGDVADPESARAAALRVEDYLDARHASLAKAAVNALGRLGARESVPALVELLADEDAGLARTAHAALQRLTGLRFRGDPGPWRAWLASEEAWLDERLPRVLRALQDADPAVVREALRELETHALDRHALADDVATLLLGREELELRIAACDALRRLGSRAPLAALIDALADEPPVAEAARAALVAVTDLDRGSEPLAWEEALAARR